MQAQKESCIRSSASSGIPPNNSPKIWDAELPPHTKLYMSFSELTGDPDMAAERRKVPGKSFGIDLIWNLIRLDFKWGY
jgi:hypothetical protein